MEKLKRFVNRFLSSDKCWTVLIFIITFAAFSPALTFKELISDDLFYYLNVVAASKSLERIFDPVLGLRTPLTALSLYGDFKLWGAAGFTAGAHLTNILLHCVSAFLFYRLLRSLKWGNEVLTPAWAGTAALIFALHPQRVESVAWLCERKDCLAMSLGLAALLFFLHDMRKERISWLSAICLVLSFLAKPLWLFFFVPAAALIWSERRTFQWQLYLKLLFLPLLIFGVFTTFYLYEMEPAVPNPGMAVPLLFKAETILHNYGNYFVRTFLPGNLFPLYPYYNPEFDPRWMALVPIALCFVPFFAREKEFRPAVIYGILPLLICFAAVLLPVVGFQRVGNTDFADRYSYLPSLFLITGSVFLLKLNIPLSSAFGKWFPVMGVLCCGGMFYKTAEYLPVWKTPRSITERSIAPRRPNFNAAIAAATFCYNRGEYEKAGKICEEKLTDSPYYPEDFKKIIKVYKLYLKGLILFRQGKPESGITCLKTVYDPENCGMVRHLPMDLAAEVFSRGAEYLLKKEGNRKGAAALYQRCSASFSTRSPWHEAFYAGMSAKTEEKYADAVKCFKQACAIAPENRISRQELENAIIKAKEQKK